MKLTLQTSVYLGTNLGTYYLRARYMNTNGGRFTTADTYEGESEKPITRALYLYGNDDPVNTVDPDGHFGEDIGALAVSNTLNALSLPNLDATTRLVRNQLWDDPKDLWLVPIEDHQLPVAKKKSFWQPTVVHERTILYELQRKDGKPLKPGKWTTSEHQTEKSVAPPNGTSSQGRNHFCDDIFPGIGRRPSTTDQTFTISKSGGDFNPKNENSDVIVHTPHDGDFGTLAILLDADGIKINGLYRWTGVADGVCQGNE